MVTLLSLKGANFLSHQHWLKIKGDHLELQKCKSTGKTPAGLNLPALQFCLPAVSRLAGVLFIETGLSRRGCCFLLVNSEILPFSPSDTHRHQLNTNIHLENSKMLGKLSIYLQRRYVQNLFLNFVLKSSLKANTKKKYFHILKLFKNLRFDLFQ